MNKIYKVVWNNTLQCFTVVSEIAKSHTKNQAKAVVGSVLFTTLLGMSASANADNYDPSQSDYDSSLVFDTNKSYFLQNDAALTVNNALTVENGAQVIGRQGQSIDVKGDASILNDLKIDESYTTAPASSLAISKLNVDGSLKLKADDFFNNSHSNGSWITRPLARLDVETATIGKDLTLEKAIVYSEKIAGSLTERGSMEVSGDVSLNSSTLSVGTSTFTTKGDLTATDGSFLLVMSGDAELKIGNNLKVSDSSIQVSDTGKLNVDGAATVNNTRFVVGKNSEFNVAEDFTFTGKANFNAYSNAQVNVDGNFVLNTDNGDYNNSGVSDGAVLTVGNDLIVNGDSYLCNHDNATVNVKGNLELNNRKDDIINSVAYDNVQVNVDGDLKVKGGSSFGTNHNVDVMVKGNLDHCKWWWVLYLQYILLKYKCNRW